MSSLTARPRPGSGIASTASQRTSRRLEARPSSDLESGDGEDAVSFPRTRESRRPRGLSCWPGRLHPALPRSWTGGKSERPRSGLDSRVRGNDRVRRLAVNAPAAPEAFAERRPAGHPPVKNGQVGVLLVNLGTPEATDYWSMRRYLDEFLSDRRVIETPRWLWWPILNLVILTRRPRLKGPDYDSIWNKERDESPLMTITRAQSQKLGGMLASTA